MGSLDTSRHAFRVSMGLRTSNIDYLNQLDTPPGKKDSLIDDEVFQKVDSFNGEDLEVKSQTKKDENQEKLDQGSNNSDLLLSPDEEIFKSRKMT